MLMGKSGVLPYHVKMFPLKEWDVPGFWSVGYKPGISSEFFGFAMFLGASCSNGQFCFSG